MERPPTVAVTHPHTHTGPRVAAIETGEVDRLKDQGVRRATQKMSRGHPVAIRSNPAGPRLLRASLITR